METVKDVKTSVLESVVTPAVESYESIPGSPTQEQVENLKRQIDSPSESVPEETESTALAVKTPEELARAQYEQEVTALAIMPLAQLGDPAQFIHGVDMADTVGIVLSPDCTIRDYAALAGYNALAPDTSKWRKVDLAIAGRGVFKLSDLQIATFLRVNSVAEVQMLINVGTRIPHQDRLLPNPGLNTRDNVTYSHHEVCANKVRVLKVPGERKTEENHTIKNRLMSYLRDYAEGKVKTVVNGVETALPVPTVAEWKKIASEFDKAYDAVYAIKGLLGKKDKQAEIIDGTFRLLESGIIPESANMSKLDRAYCNTVLKTVRPSAKVTTKLEDTNPQTPAGTGTPNTTPDNSGSLVLRGIPAGVILTKCSNNVEKAEKALGRMVACLNILLDSKDRGPDGEFAELTLAAFAESLRKIDAEEFTHAVTKE